MKKYSIPVWYVITLVFTGLLLLPHLVWQGAGDYSISFTQFGPFLATLFLLKLTRNESAAVAVKSGLRFNKRQLSWYVLSAFIPVLLTFISSFVLTVCFNSRYNAWNGTPVLYVISFAAMFLGSIGEELGWRGYLLPELNKKLSPFVSSIAVGLLWGFWHLNYAGDIVFWLLFIITTTELSVLFTFLLNKTGGNLWTAVIFHAVFNLANRIFIWERFNTKLLLIEIVVFGLACAVILSTDKKNMFKKKE